MTFSTSNDNEKDKPELTEGQFLTLLDHIIHNVDLPSFLETDAGCNVRYANEESCVCCCPIHNEKKPSFRLTLMDGVWIYFCFGCGVKGHIVHFFMDFYEIPNKFEAVLAICERFGFETSTDMLLDGIKRVQKRVDIQKELECANIVASNQCRNLLRKDYKLYNDWVASTYRALNAALDICDLDTVRQIGVDASNKVMES